MKRSIFGDTRVVLPVMPLIACFYQPHGAATGESATTGTEATTGASTSEPTAGPPTSDTATTTPECDGDGMCDPDENGEDCPDDCDNSQVCGDGLQSGDETCDEGPNNGSYGHCDVDCSGVIGCGDAEVNGDEVCDDGPDNSDDYAPSAHCNADCSDQAPHCGDGACAEAFESLANCPGDCPATCGNGVPEPGEVCDDGDGAPADTVQCDADCTAPLCGDGYVNGSAGEECDDADADDTDDCPSSCKPAACGDGFVHTGAEECDDANAVNDDECSDNCALPRIVFVSSTKMDGDLMGLDGADLRCQTLAGAAGLPGTFRGWLSSAEEGPSDRFDTTFTGAYHLRDGTVVAGNGWIDLSNGNLDARINRDEIGDPISGDVWTNTLPDGTPASDQDCGGWASAVGMSTVGSTSLADAGWTNYDSERLCSVPRRLYCFEDAP